VLDLGKTYLNDKSKIIVLPKVHLRKMEKSIIHNYLRLFDDLDDQIQLENHNNLIEDSNEVMRTMIEMIGTQEVMRIIIILEIDEIAGITLTTTVISETDAIAEITITVISGITTIIIEITTMIAKILLGIVDSVRMMMKMIEIE